MMRKDTGLSTVALTLQVNFKPSLTKHLIAELIRRWTAFFAQNDEFHPQVKANDLSLSSEGV